MATIQLIVPVCLSAQNYDAYPDSVIELCNTGMEADYLTEAEKETLLLLNLIRYDGTLLWVQVAAPYISENEIKEDRYTRSLERDLQTVKRRSVLHPSSRLHEAATRHAVASGKNGSLGHTSTAGTFEKRLRPLGDEFNFILENCDYGSSEAIDIVMNLMIDKGVPDFGHRKNILHESIDRIGVDIAPHKTYNANCVQIFGQLREPE